MGMELNCGEEWDGRQEKKNQSVLTVERVRIQPSTLADLGKEDARRVKVACLIEL